MNCISKYSVMYLVVMEFVLPFNKTATGKSMFSCVKINELEVTLISIGDV